MIYSLFKLVPFWKRSINDLIYIFMDIIFIFNIYFIERDKEED